MRETGRGDPARGARLRCAMPDHTLIVSSGVAMPMRLVLEDDVQSVEDTGNVTQNSEEDVDEEVSSAATLEEDTQRREDDGKKDLADVAGGERHVGGCVVLRLKRVEYLMVPKGCWLLMDVCGVVGYL